MREYTKPEVIAEIGANHAGKFSTALRLIRAAAEAGAAFVKFQKRDIDTWAERMPKVYYAPHPNEHNAYGATYKEHREALELTKGDLSALKIYANDIGIDAFTSVWDVASAEEMLSVFPDHVKVPSACNADLKLIGWLLANHPGYIHISLGMMLKEESRALFDLVSRHPARHRVIWYHCVSDYPVSHENANLTKLLDLAESVDGRIALSGHHNGIALDIAAMMLGASYIERHFTLDRTRKGTDHAASLEPSGLAKLCRDLAAVEAACRPHPDGVLSCEWSGRNKLKWVSNDV